jgi:hypothetical protein
LEIIESINAYFAFALKLEAGKVRSGVFYVTATTPHVAPFVSG